MFKKILIANRGEIACRVIRTAQEMGIATVAVYSDADRDALHVMQADEAVHIGPAPSTESYLRIERIVQACKDTGAEAVHPGYGFLSENKTFALALEEAGIAFIGPNVRAIEAMGDKIESKKIAQQAQVSTIPGYTGVIKDAEEAVRISQEVGYPVMLKASAGGGGKGMRIARDDDQCRDGFERASNEARSSFGDDRVFVEKFIEQPRHIEIQVIADSHGNTLYLGERECSLQRRHQKVVEEAPSPLLDAQTRQAMGEQAVALARAVDYRSAGTVEFIVEPNRNFYFLEMNTRLQVEHPVTEWVTGLDLVELMIRVAAGEKLPLTQEEVQLKGWAIETRVYAEDPFRGFLPSTGRLVHYRPPDGERVRVDTGVREGGEVSMYYDPMIAKLITYGDDRQEAIRRMRGALDRYLIKGVSHNIAFLAALMVHPRFVSGDMSTNLIAEEYPQGFNAGDTPKEDPLILIAIAATVHRRYRERDTRITGQLPGHERVVRNEWVVLLDDTQHLVRVAAQGGEYQVECEGQTVTVKTAWRFGDPLILAILDGKPIAVQIERVDQAYLLTHAGTVSRVLVLRPRVAELYGHMPEREEPDLSQFLLSPMPGLLVSLLVAEGDTVEAGQELAVVEAMKMENTLRAEKKGVVSKILAQSGDTLVVDQKILEFE